MNKEQKTAYYLKRRQDRKMKAIALKGGSCHDCGYDDLTYLGVFHFDHRDPKTKFKRFREVISSRQPQKGEIIKIDGGRHLAVNHTPKMRKIITSSSGNMSDDQFWKEIEKCDLVCANCHAIRTAKRLAGIAVAL